MRNLDNEKDLFIKNKLQEDKLISKKADDIFNKLNKGEFFMDENKKINNPNSTKENYTNKKNFSKWKKLLATAASFVIIIGAANVYATTQGYDNIFFLVKYLVTGEKNVSGKDNILSDRDITISYEPINIGNGLNITIKKLQIKDNETKLFVITNEKDPAPTGILPLTFKAYNDKNQELCNQKSVKEDQNRGAVTDELLLKDFKGTDNIINLDIYTANSEKITTLSINLEKKTVEVQGEQEALQKISEIDLKKFLGHVASLSQKLKISDDEIKVDVACRMLSEKDPNAATLINGVNAYTVDEVNNMLESFIGKKISNFKNGMHIKMISKNGKKYFTYTNPGDDSSGAECINISNISYCNGEYTVNYSFYYRGGEPDEDVNMENYDIYEQEVHFSFNENSNYSKYLVTSKEKPSIIKKANTGNNNTDTTAENTSSSNTTSNNSSANTAHNTVASNTTSTNTTASNDKTNTTSNSNNKTNSNTNTTSNNTNKTTSNTNTTSNANTNNSKDDKKSSNKKVDNYASTMSWSEYWSPGIKLQYPSNWEIEEIGGYYRGNRQGELSTVIRGIAEGIDKETNDIVKTTVEIQIYEPEFTDALTATAYYNKKTNSSISDVESVSGYTMNNSGRWYLHSNTQNGKETQTYIHYDNQLHVGYVIKIITNTPKVTNWKVINITNWIFGSIKFTSW